MMQSRNAQDKQQPEVTTPSQKKQYAKPSLLVYGTFNDITQGNLANVLDGLVGGDGPDGAQS
jgi:hypothetical protein